MKALFVALRAVHYASAILLFGELVFVLAVASPIFRQAAGGNGGVLPGRRRFFAVAGWSLIAGVVSGAGWFGIEAVLMSGLPAGEAMTRDTLGVVLGNTGFGRVFALRFGLTIALGGALLSMWRSTSANAARIRAFATPAFANQERPGCRRPALIDCG